TEDKKSQPDAHVMLLKGFDKNGFSFFTNYKSAKGREIASNKKACLNFYWNELSRQVRIKGTVIKLSSKASDDYFQSRPRESQISAWTSQQSVMIESRDLLEENYQAIEKKYSN